MSFKPDKVGDFMDMFKRSKKKISAFSGCHHLALHRDQHEVNVYFTVSHWESSKHLELYRKSDLFKSTWGQVKPLFNAEPLAYSLTEVDY